TAGTEGASDAHVSKGKEPVVSHTADVAPGAEASEVRTSENVVSAVSAKEKIPKKPRTQNKKAPKIMRKMVVQEEDEEETD
ncbi:hypothetical protein A2U01_0064647, partial [Trifolium medium]|nr:hypothetical protein [Trifolium medium]